MKKFKKIMAACLAAVMAMSMAITASAETVESTELNALGSETDMIAQAYNDGFSLVSDEVFADEDDSSIIHHITVFEREENSGISVASANAITTKTYKVSHTMGTSDKTYGHRDWVNMWVQGTFSYDNDAYIVVDDKTFTGGATEIDGYKIIGKSLGCESDKGANLFWGRKYAIIWIDVTMTNNYAGNKTSFHLSLDVNVEGKYNATPRKGPKVELLP